MVEPLSRPPTLGGFLRGMRRSPKTSLAVGGAIYWFTSWTVGKWRIGLERDRILKVAKWHGQQPIKHTMEEPKRVMVIISPTAGHRDGQKCYEKDIRPVFHLAGVDVDVERTQRDWPARYITKQLNIKDYDALVLIGGSGLLQDAVTGLLKREDDAEEARKLPICLIPVGTATPVGKLLHTHASVTRTSQVCRAALGVVEGNTRPIDVISVASPTKQAYLMSHIAWGIPGATAARNQIRRWPGTHRYDVSGFWSMLKDWFSMPCKATLSVKLGDQPLSEGTLGERLPGAWDERGIEVTGLIASNLSDLNLGRPINPDQALDDGFLTLSWFSGGFTSLWSSVLQAGRGVPVVEQEGWETIRTKEFILVPEGCEVTPEGVAAVAAAAPAEQKVPAHQQGEFTFHPAVEEDWKPLVEHPVPFSLDGTVANSAAIHVKVLPRHMQLIVPSSN